MKRLLFILLIAIALTSCDGEGEASIEKTIVVEQIEANEINNQCNGCLQNSYSYRVKLTSHSGNVYYYTNYKHEVGDTLLSIFEITDNRDGIIKTTENKIDSLIGVNLKLTKKNEELELYNTLLIGIIKEGTNKNSGN